MEMLGLLAIPVGIVNVVCLVLVLIKLFPAEGPLKGILGVICGLYTFIWGWKNADQHNLRTIMMVWTGFLILAVIVNVMTSMSAAART